MANTAVELDLSSKLLPNDVHHDVHRQHEGLCRFQISIPNSLSLSILVAYNAQFCACAWQDLKKPDFDYQV